MCLLLFTSYAAAQECGCNICHGNPPLYDNTFGGPNGLVGAPLTGATSAGAHAQHVKNFTGPSLNDICYECHFGGMPFSSMCGNNKLQIGFAILAFGGAGSNYDGHTLNPPYSYEGTNSTTITTGGTKVCSNIYCHSDGTAVVTGVIGAGSHSPAWDSKAGPLPCNFCHNYPPSYPQLTNAGATPKANAHAFHSSLASCEGCHYGAVNTMDKHPNGVYDVAPAPGLTYNDLPATFTYRPDPGGIGGFCDNVTCHGGLPNTAFWGKFLPFISGIASTIGPGCFEVRNFNIPAANFTNTTFPITYKWDFGNGDTESGTAANAPVVSTSSHTYPSPGPFKVTFTGRDALKRYIYKQQDVNPQPAANISARGGFTTSVNRYIVTLTDLSYDPDYNQCGHSGDGRIYIEGSGISTINGKPSPLDEPITLTDQPSNKTYTVVYAATVGSNLRTIYHKAADNVDKNSLWTVNDYKTNNIPGPTALSGLVTAPDGTGISGATVNLKQTTGALIKSTTTGANGSYSFSGTWTLACFLIEAVKTGYNVAPAPQTVCINRSDVNFTASPQ
jgi:predicted CxxxxCH...CXXCH cytochrome family protein